MPVRYYLLREDHTYTPPKELVAAEGFKQVGHSAMPNYKIVYINTDDFTAIEAEAAKDTRAGRITTQRIKESQYFDRIKTILSRQNITTTQEAIARVKELLELP